MIAWFGSNIAFLPLVTWSTQHRQHSTRFVLLACSEAIWRILKSDLALFGPSGPGNPEINPAFEMFPQLLRAAPMY